MFNRSNYDVIVVGAGPAGSTAARAAAQNGVSVLMLEKDREIGIPVRCAEGISGRSLCAFVQPNSRWIAREIVGARLIAPDGNFIDVTDHRFGYVLERRIFDRFLAELAVSAGAEVRVKSEVTDVLWDDQNNICGVKVSQGNQAVDIKAKIVIGCDGIESRIGYWAGLKTTLKLSEVESCYQYLAGNLNIDSELCYFYVGSNYAPGGYAWVFPKGNSIANIGLGIVGDKHKIISAKKQLDTFMKNQYPDAIHLSEIAGGVPVCLYLKKMVAPGLILAGDAAHQVNPLTGGGIAGAMFGGYEAGCVAAQAIKEDNLTEKRLAEYHQRWAKVQGNKLKHYDRLAKAVAKISDESLNRTCFMLKKIDKNKITLGEIFKTALTSDPKLLLDITKVFFS